MARGEINASKLLGKIQKQQRFIFNESAEFERVGRKDFFGAEHVLRQADDVIDILKNFPKYRENGVKFSGGVIIHGPRRIGKTMLARYIATGSEAKFVDVRSFPVDLKSGVHAWQEHDIRSLFRLSEAWTEAHKKPIVLFVDQFDEWLQVHGNVITQLEIELAGFAGRKQGVYIVATARNNPDESKISLFLGGRIDKWIAMSFPDKKQQADLLDGFLSRYPHESGIDTKSLVYIFDDGKEASAGKIEACVNSAHQLAVRKALMAGGKNVHKTAKISEDHLVEIFLSEMLDPPTGHEPTEEDKRITRIHELGHYIVARALGIPGKIVSTRPGLSSLGLTFVSGPNQSAIPIEYLRNLLVVKYGGIESQALFGIPPMINEEGDMDRGSYLARTLVYEYCRRSKMLLKKYGLLTVVLKDEGDADNSVGHGPSDDVADGSFIALLEKDAGRLVVDAQKKTRKIVRFFGKKVFLRAADALARKTSGLMLQRELDALLEPKLSEYHRRHKIKDYND